VILKGPRVICVPGGGHFFAAEEPRLLAEELRAFLRPFRRSA